MKRPAELTENTVVVVVLITGILVTAASGADSDDDGFESGDTLLWSDTVS